MLQAVIVATARSPIGRAGNGSLNERRPDDLAVQMVQAVLAKVPELAPSSIADLILGCGQPAGAAGNNLSKPEARDPIFASAEMITEKRAGVGRRTGTTRGQLARCRTSASLQWHDKRIGIESMCVGGGERMAMVLERLS
ncbi:hypothetical protein [Kribbella speibonae]|uniref:Thiolase N-terminal domain-containing protein n=1 Tax=Kribbella speibonae TaxID=1572660 RepID=A0A4R0J538_9ACTN|nr:hypothetical protein [Kribbella speibonae]TCC36425.1 hypothetical protein E0H92_27730 [Kribbella speibonae]